MQSNKKSFPLSITSCCRGCSLCFIFILLVGSSVLLWGITQLELYHGPKSDCDRIGSLPLVGGSNAVYCPNPYLISSVRFKDTTHTTNIKQTTKQPVISSKTKNSEENYFYSWSGDDKVGDKDYSQSFYFNLNKGSKLYFNVFQNVNDLEMYITNQLFPKTTIKANSNFKKTLDIEEDGFYTVKLESKNVANSGQISFNVTQTIYIPDPDETGDLESCVLGIDCDFTIDFGKESCFILNNVDFINYFYSSACVDVVQKGHEMIWIGIVIPLTLILVVIIAIISLVIGSFAPSSIDESKEFHYIPVSKNNQENISYSYISENDSDSTQFNDIETSKFNDFGSTKFNDVEIESD
eukprot:TRINITY_DN418_c0_g1_i1.p1 TRINITY_DN418_c0_g1~~TRINITY_DN418_c0_g1_i1.p1  ORF type:complete len:352 (+),score=96.64 TRINITY_DN418_c0_g1_i1:45-1100(+)